MWFSLDDFFLLKSMIKFKKKEDRLNIRLFQLDNREIKYIRLMHVDNEEIRKNMSMRRMRFANIYLCNKLFYNPLTQYQITKN